MDFGEGQEETIHDVNLISPEDSLLGSSKLGFCRRVKVILVGGHGDGK